ncbi:MAG: hypothetical protein HQL31_10950, partial [Planctomycetes bacterium]|nr:hypothetical protein [Planctomycetota bacterium]
VNVRELAEVTRLVMKEAEEWMAKGRILFFFPEGSRSRSGTLQRFIPACARYIEAGQDPIVFPLGTIGTEGLLGVEDEGIHARNITLRVGAGISLGELSRGMEEMKAGEARKALLDRLGFAVASLLPPEMQGEYRLDGELEGELGPARQWAADFFFHLRVLSNER